MAITSDTGKPESRLPVGDAHTGESERARFEKNANLERLLARINDYLRAAEQAQPAPPELDFPLILLVGAPRSGTTLFMQWLDATGAIGVPSNLISRFFVAPAFGVMLQRLLTDPMYRYREELDWPGELSPSLASDLGKTKGLLGHNSFFYFWRQFISLTEPAEMTHAQLSRVDKDGLARAVRRFAAEIGKPLAMKGYLVQYHLRLLESILDRVLFVHITRDPIAVMASLLAVRRRLHGHERAWWGCRPPGYEALEKAEPALQVAGQIALTNKSIRTELQALPTSKSLSVSYEQLCTEPAAVWTMLCKKIAELSSNDAYAERLATAKYLGPRSLQLSERQMPKREQYLAAWAAATQL